MKHKDIILFIFFLIISLTKSFATAQIPDILFYNGDTLSIFANPLEPLLEKLPFRPKFFGKKEGCNSTDCWRGYYAEWEIVDNQLYLTGIYSCCYYEDKIKADLKSIAGKYYINGKIKASWFTNYIIAPLGKELYYVHMGYGSLYEKELEFKFINGCLIGTKIYDNSKSKQSIYSQDDEKRNKFIYSNINWSVLPKLFEKEIKVYVQFSANEKGIIDSVKVMRGYDNIFDQEAIRVVKAIPDWDIFYRHEKFERRSWGLPVIFSDENRKKYKN